MITPLRISVREIFGLLAKLSIRKHQTRIIVIIGRERAELIKEQCYRVLSDLGPVRRNTRQIVWDLAVPLNILGAPVYKRNVFHWFMLTLIVSVRLFFFKSHQHTVILSFDSAHADIAKYWGRIFAPDYVIYARRKKEKQFLKEYLTKIHSSDTTVILHEADMKNLRSVVKGKNIKVYGKKQGDLLYSIGANSLTLSYKGKTSRLKVKDVAIPLIELLVPGYFLRLLLGREIIGMHLGMVPVPEELRDTIIRSFKSGIDARQNKKR